MTIFRTAARSNAVAVLSGRKRKLPDGRVVGYRMVRGGAALRFQHLGVFQEGVEGHAARGDVTGPAVEEIALADVEAQEGQARIQHQAQSEQSRWLAQLVLDQAAGIAVDLVHPDRQLRLAVMAEFGMQVAHGAAHFRRGVDRHRVHAAATLAEQAQLPVRPGRRMRPAPEQPFPAREPITVGVRGRQHRLDAFAATRREFLVGVEQQHPVVRRLVHRRLLLRAVALERLDEPARAPGMRDRGGRVGGRG